MLQVLSLTHTYRDTGTRALEDFSLTLEPGKVQALVGDNGTGKTTLVKLVAGALQLQGSSQILLEGTPLKGGIAERESLGIYWVPQNAATGEELRVWEHVILGQPKSFWGILSPLKRKANQRKIQKVMDRYSLNLPLDQRVKFLNAGQLQLLHLLTALMGEPRVLLLDEPTASMSEGDSRRIEQILKKICEKGSAVLLITHKLDEVYNLSDNIALLGKGQIIHRCSRENLSWESFLDRFPDYSPGVGGNFNEPKGDRVLQIKGLHLELQGQLILKELDLSLHRGEILSILGERADGLEALEDMVYGLISPTRGQFHIQGKAFERLDPKLLRELGLGYVPTDRLGRGGSSGASLEENLIPHRVSDLQIRGFLLPGAIKQFFRQIKTLFGLRGKGEQALETLSGGNIQKFILTREVESRPDVLLVSEPTWGLDQKNRRSILELLKKSAAQGMSILILSSDPEEALEVSHRVGVLYRGQLVDLREAKAWSAQELRSRLIGLTPKPSTQNTKSILKSKAPQSPQKARTPQLGEES